MFEFLLNNSNTENPTQLSIMITVLCAFFLSSLIVLTYEVTSRDVNRPTHFLQSMALIAIVSATIMQAIGDSLARGLGMLGALAIIRFRTKLDDPRNITFMFASIAAGIACGVFGFTTAFIGTIGFCCAAFIMRVSPLSDNNNLVGSLRIRVPLEGNTENVLKKVIKSYCRAHEIEQIRLLNLKVNTGEEETIEEKDRVPKETESEVIATTAEGEKIAIVKEVERMRYKELTIGFRLKKRKKFVEFSDEIERLEDVRGVRIRFGKQRLTL